MSDVELWMFTSPGLLSLGSLFSDHRAHLSHLKGNLRTSGTQHGFARLVCPACLAVKYASIFFS